MDFRFGTHDAGGIRIDYAEIGRPDAPMILCLHGFPEYWAGWRPVMQRLAGDFRLVAPDQRGYNRSSKPEGVAAYRVGHLAADIASLADELSPDRPFVLAGHDWGASVAYAYAFKHPERLSHLVVANGVHPVCFQRALIEDEAQRKASQYIPFLCSDRAEPYLSENGYERVLWMIGNFSKADFLDEETRAGYLDAWSQPGALTGMLNWYRASPIIVPEGDAPPGSGLALDLLGKVADYEVRMPHLLLWGEEDAALLPSVYAHLGDFAPDLTIRRFPNASHWLLHEKPDKVADAIRSFVGGGE